MKPAVVSVVVNRHRHEDQDHVTLLPAIDIDQYPNLRKGEGVFSIDRMQPNLPRRRLDQYKKRRL
jgi:hypothetical protein